MHQYTVLNHTVASVRKGKQIKQGAKDKQNMMSENTYVHP